jgi:hypothetical protein
MEQRGLLAPAFPRPLPGAGVSILGIFSERGMVPITVKHTASGLYVAERAWWANTAWNRAWGWLGKEKAEPGEGLLLKPCSSIHTLGMKFPMDLLFLDSGRRER